MESAKNKIIFLSSLILLTIIIAFTLIIVERKTTEEIFLTKEEIAWLNDYHAEVYARLAPHLDEEEKKWLKNATKAIK